MEKENKGITYSFFFIVRNKTSWCSDSVDLDESADNKTPRLYEHCVSLVNIL